MKEFHCGTLVPGCEWHTRAEDPLPTPPQTLGRAVYVAVGTGPPPPPAPQVTGSGSIVAFGDTSQSGGGGSAGGGGGGANASIRLSVSPRVAQAGRRTSFLFTARTGSGPVAGATIRFVGLEAVTNSQGRARLAAALRSGTYKARAAKSGKSYEEEFQAGAKMNPAGRFGTPEEFGAACAFLCSVHASYITGQNLLMDGGQYPGTY